MDKTREIQEKAERRICRKVEETEGCNGNGEAPPVQLCFTEGGPTLHTLLARYLRQQRRRG